MLLSTDYNCKLCFLAVEALIICNKRELQFHYCWKATYRRKSLYSYKGSFMLTSCAVKWWWLCSWHSKLVRFFWPSVLVLWFFSIFCKTLWLELDTSSKNYKIFCTKLDSFTAPMSSPPIVIQAPKVVK